MNPEDNKTVSITASELGQIIKRLKELENIVGSGKPQLAPTAVKERKVTIFFIEGRAVIGYVNHGLPNRPQYTYEKQDPMNPRERILCIDVLVQGKKEPYKLMYNEFMQNCHRAECPVKETKVTAWTIEQGITPSRTLPDGSYEMKEDGVLMPVEVRGVTRTFSVELPDGTITNIDEQFVNINK